MPLMKSLDRIKSKGQIGVPPQLLKMKDAKPGQIIEFVLRDRGPIQVFLTHLKIERYYDEH